VKSAPNDAKCCIGDFSDLTIFDFPAISCTAACVQKRPYEHRGDVQPYLPLWQSSSSDKSWRRYKTDYHVTFHCFWQLCTYFGFVFLSVQKGYALFSTVKGRLMLGSSRTFNRRLYLKFAMEKKASLQKCTCAHFVHFAHYVQSAHHILQHFANIYHALDADLCRYFLDTLTTFDSLNENSCLNG
jgi:hypothetical protein